MSTLSTFSEMVAPVNALDEALDVAITLVGDDGIRRVVEEALGLEDDFVAVGPGSELLDSLLVAFKELDGIVATLVVGDGAGKLVLNLGKGRLEFGSEADRLRDDALASRLHGGGNQILEAVALECRYFDNRYLELLGELFGFDGIAALLDDVHLVERDHDGNVKLHELSGQVEVALEVRGIDDIDDDVGMTVDQIVAGDDLLARIRGQRVDSRQVDELDVLVVLEVAGLPLHRHARPVAHVLVIAGELVEQRRLA